MDKMLSTQEVSKALGVSDKTIRQWLRDGTLKGYKVGPRLWKVSETDLAEFVTKSRNATATESATEADTNTEGKARETLICEHCEQVFGYDPTTKDGRHSAEQLLSLHTRCYHE